MKKFLAITALALLASVSLTAQDMASATETARLAKSAIESGDYKAALSGFQEALKVADESGEEGVALAQTCKSIIPKLMKTLAKESLEAGDYDTAVATLTQTASVARMYGDTTGIVQSVNSLIPDILVKKAGKLLEAGQYSEAASVCRSALGKDPANGLASLRLGIAEEALGNDDAALQAYGAAAANGQEANAAAKLGRFYLKRAIKELKSKDFPAAVKDAVASDGYVPNPQALQIAGNASMLSGKREDAITYFERYLEASPKASNATEVAYALGSLYKEGNNVAKAREFFGKAASDPKYGADAKKALAALK